jgi:hypothetical protein
VDLEGLMDPEDEETPQERYERLIRGTRVTNRDGSRPAVEEDPDDGSRRRQRTGRAGSGRRRSGGLMDAFNALADAETEAEIRAAFARTSRSPETAAREAERYLNMSPEERQQYLRDRAENEGMRYDPERGFVQEGAEGAEVGGEGRNQRLQNAAQTYKDLGFGDDEARAMALAELQREQWYALGDTRPTIDQLTADLQGEGLEDELGSLVGGDSRLEGLNEGLEREAQVRALRQMQGLVDDKGYTDADYAMMNAARLSRGAQMRGANAAAIQQAQARGVGGGGQELLARMGASQAANTANAMSDAQIQQAAMQRALAAMQYSGQQAGQMYDQEAARRSALDAFNQANLDWRRGREMRNTGTANERARSRAGAYQTDFQNRAAAQQGADTGYANVTDGQRHEQSRQDAQEDRYYQIAGAGIGAASNIIPTCCAPDTQVATPQGAVPISALVVGDTVLAQVGAGVDEVEVTSIGAQAVTAHTAVRLELTDGSEWLISAPHPLPDGRLVGDLRPGDPWGHARVRRAELVQYPHASTHDVRTSAPDGSYLLDGGLPLGTTIPAGAS